MNIMTGLSPEAICSDVFDGDLELKTLQDWLGQFDEADVASILRLLDHFTYFSLRKVKSLLRKIHGDLAAAISVSVGDTIIVPIGYAAKSGGTIAHLYRLENTLSENLFLAASDLTKIDASRVRHVVFIDDYIGSGYQGRNLWNYLTETFPEARLRGWRIFYMVVAGTEGGAARIRKETRFEVLTGLTLLDSENVLSPQSHVFAEDDRRAIVEVVRKYGLKLFPMHPLGYNRSQALVGFFYSTPNNTLPIFWAKHNGWQPLLPHGDAHREPAYLLSPLAKAGLYEFEKMPSRIRLDDDPEMSSLLLGEFRTLRNVRLVVDALQQLDVSHAVLSRMLKSLKVLSMAEHEHQPIHCSLLLVSRQFDARRFPEHPLYLSVVPNEEKAISVESLAELSDGKNSGVIIDADGRVLGLMSFSLSQGYSNDFLPDAYWKLASTSRNVLGLAFLVSGNTSIDIFWNGQRILQHRKTNWHLPYTKEELRNFCANWASTLNLRQMVVMYCLSLATNMVDKGVGALIVIGATDEILRQYADCKQHRTRFGDSEIFNFPTSGVERIVSQDGATLIDNQGRLREFMVRLKLPPGVVADEDQRKGTKHDTAAKLSKLCQCLCIAVSVDRNFSVYQRGQLVLRAFG